MQVAEDRWVPPPDVDGALELRNLAKEAEGVTLKATRKFYEDDRQLLNLLRLGSIVGEPMYAPGKAPSVRGGSDGHPKLLLDFGRVVELQRVGAICSCTDRFRDWFEVWSTTDAHPAEDAWESWGVDAASQRPEGIFFLDRPPTLVRCLMIKASSGRVPGGRVQHLFAYGLAGPGVDPTGSHNSGAPELIGSTAIAT
eukprot:TRINITY_DN21644_c0_g1_i2.p1 TRINITY_DN21644_c0_g1~~TRINITY_DN21644_c0_g1_i2.p1  ORF type:complete len:197 (-),score=41.64 TRINITY_DN21644_c0_g1_i2:94-684(-)